MVGSGDVPYRSSRRNQGSNAHGSAAAPGMPFKSRRMRPKSGNHVGRHCQESGNAPCSRNPNGSSDPRQSPRGPRIGRRRTDVTRRRAFQAAPWSPGAGAVSGCPRRGRVVPDPHPAASSCRSSVLGHCSMVAEAVRQCARIMTRTRPPGRWFFAEGKRTARHSEPAPCSAVGYRMGLRQDSNPRCIAGGHCQVWREHDAKSQEHSNDRRTLVTLPLMTAAGIMGEGDDALRHRLGSDCPRRARREDLGRHHARQRGRLRRVQPAAPPRPCADPVRPPAIPDHCCRPTLGRRFGAVPGAGQRGARR